MDYNAISINSIERNNNEDHFINTQVGDFVYLAVADGVGGLSFADIASQLAIQPFNQITIPPTTSLESYFQDANQLIIKESEKKNRMMGSTLVSAMINTKTKEITIAHVGDSRAYIFSNNGTWRTKDDTLVQELVDMGIITEEQAFEHPNKNRLNKALGTCENLNIDIFNTTLEEHSTILLSTDGLHDYVKDEDIRTIVMTESPKKAIEILVEKARENNSTDDITIIIVQIDE